jgi:hypothetical protein
VAEPKWARKGSVDAVDVCGVQLVHAMPCDCWDVSEMHLLELHSV